MYKHNLQPLFIITILLVSSCTQLSQADHELASTKPEIEPSEAISEADQLYRKRNDLDNVRQAIKILEKARNPEQRNFIVETKLARCSYFLGSRESVDDDEAEKVLKRGLSAANIAKRLEPNKPDGYFWHGAVIGAQSKRSPITVGIVSFKKIRSSMAKVIEIDPGFQGASAYDALGQLELGTRGLAGGSAEKAVEYFEKAFELNKRNSYIRLHLGEAYLAVNKDSLAKEQLQNVLSMQAHPDYIPEHEESVKKAKKLLEQKF